MTNEQIAREIVLDIKKWNSKDISFGDYQDDVIQEITQALDKKGQTIRELRTALEFYADMDNWKIPSYSGGVKEIIAMSDLGCKSFNGENDFKDFAIPSGGRRAREAIAKHQNKVKDGI